MEVRRGGPCDAEAKTGLVPRRIGAADEEKGGEMFCKRASSSDGCAAGVTIVKGVVRVR